MEKSPAWGAGLSAFWSVIVIANGFSSSLATIRQAWMEFAQIILMKCDKLPLTSSLGENPKLNMATDKWGRLPKHIGEAIVKFYY